MNSGRDVGSGGGNRSSLVSCHLVPSLTPPKSRYEVLPLSATCFAQ